MNKATFTLAELAELSGATLDGDPDHRISGIATLKNAESDQLSFLANPKYAKYLEDTNAGMVILNEEAATHFKGNKLIHANPYLVYAKLTHLWAINALSDDEGGVNEIHSTAQIDESVTLGEGVQIGPGVVIARNAVIGDKAFIGANCVIGEHSQIGQGSYLYPNVTLYHQVSVGRECIIQSGVVIGSDGFGFAPSPDGWTKIAQLGGVSIGDQVEIGANTTIDRGALDDTVIANGVIIDNQVQIAHNVEIGEGSAIAACVGIAGSTVLGKNVIVGGASGIAGHLNITDGVHITAMTMVIKSLNEPGVYSSGTGVQPNDKWRRSIARLRQLDKLANRVSQLEKQSKPQ